MTLRESVRMRTKNKSECRVWEVKEELREELGEELVGIEMI